MEQAQRSMVMQLWHDTARLKASAVSEYVVDLLAGSGSDDKFLVFAYHRHEGMWGATAHVCQNTAGSHCMYGAYTAPLVGSHTHHTPRELMDAIEYGVNSAATASGKAGAPRLRHVRIDGSTPARVREQNVAAFQEDADVRVRGKGAEGHHLLAIPPSQ